MIEVGDIIYRISKDINKVRKYSGIQFMRGLVTEESEDSDGNKVYSILFDGHKSSTEYYDREIQEMHARKELYYSYEELMDVVRNDIPGMVEKCYGKKQEIPLAKGDIAYKVYTHFGRKKERATINFAECEITEVYEKNGEIMFILAIEDGPYDSRCYSERYLNELHESKNFFYTFDEFMEYVKKIPEIVRKHYAGKKNER